MEKQNQAFIKKVTGKYHRVTTFAPPYTFNLQFSIKSSYWQQKNSSNIKFTEQKFPF